MAIFLIVFFSVCFFDYFELIKQKRTNEIVIYTIFSLLYIVLVFVFFTLNYSNSIANIILDFLIH